MYVARGHKRERDVEMVPNDTSCAEETDTSMLKKSCRRCERDDCI